VAAGGLRERNGAARTRIDNKQAKVRIFMRLSL
jgi:hypothetical protein